MDTSFQKMSHFKKCILFLVGIIAVPSIIFIVIFFSEIDACNFASVDVTNVDKFIDCELRTNFRVCDKKYGAESLLHIASRLYASADRIQKIIDAGCDVNVIHGYHFHTPLHSAAYNGNIEVSMLLILHGADITSRNRLGSTPYDLFNTSSTQRNMSSEEINKMRDLLTGVYLFNSNDYDNR